VKFLYTYLKFAIDHVRMLTVHLSTNLFSFHPHPLLERKVNFMVLIYLESYFVPKVWII
jgi:hypothetical protein